MSDIRGYTTIAEKADPSVLARQLNVHRAEMNKSIVAARGTVMQFVGDAVMAVSVRQLRWTTTPGGPWKRPSPCTPPSEK